MFAIGHRLQTLPLLCEPNVDTWGKPGLTYPAGNPLRVAGAVVTLSEAR